MTGRGDLRYESQMLWAIAMRRWTTMIGAMLLVLMLWTGATGHAAERVECPPGAIEATLHSDGQQPPAPAQPDSSTLHQHFGCSGHHLVAPDMPKPAALASGPGPMPANRQSGLHPGDEPGLNLRPPIA